MKSGFTINGIGVPPERDYRHLNEKIDSVPDVKEHIEHLEDHITELYQIILQYEPDNQNIIDMMILDEERNLRTRN